MKAKKREKMEARLLTERKEALEVLGRLDDSVREITDTEDGELSNYPQHLADQGTDTMEQEKSFLLASAEGRRLYQIDEALRRLYKEPDDFGKCSVCGAEIADERLDLIPWATTCAQHAEQDESSRTAT